MTIQHHQTEPISYPVPAASSAPSSLDAPGPGFFFPPSGGSRGPTPPDWQVLGAPFDNLAPPPTSPSAPHRSVESRRGIDFIPALAAESSVPLGPGSVLTDRFPTAGIGCPMDGGLPPFLTFPGGDSAKTLEGTSDE